MEKVSNLQIKKDDFILVIKEVNHPSRGIVQVCGPSGSGKTSFMRVLAGLDKDSASFDWTYIKKKQGFHFQDIRIFPGLSVYENLRAIDANNNDIESLLESLSMTDKKNELAQKLSGGEAQRLGFIRAIINKPDLVFLDEPFGQVDYELRKKMYKALKEYLPESALIFLSTHISNEIEIDYKIKLDQ